MNEKVKDMVENFTLRQLLANIESDFKEDGDTGFHFDMSIKEYLELLISYDD